MKCACVYFQSACKRQGCITINWCKYYHFNLDDEKKYKFFHESNGLIHGTRKIGQNGCLAQKRQLELF